MGHAVLEYLPEQEIGGGGQSYSLRTEKPTLFEEKEMELHEVIGNLPRRKKPHGFQIIK